MSEQILKEWFLEVPWGRLAVLSRGSRADPPVLLVHGHLDSCATFLPLLAKMPSSYYYVTFDFPGNGRSDPFLGPPVTYLHYVEAIRQVALQLHLHSFYCITHSLGFLPGSLYNAAFPGQIRRLVVLAGLVTLSFQGIVEFPTYWVRATYEKYYKKYPPSPSPAVTYEEAISELAKVRDVNEAGAEVLATRCLESTSDGKVRFSWDGKTKNMFPQLISEEVFLAVLSVSTPTLCFQSTEDKTPSVFADGKARMLERLNYKFNIIEVPGGHNFHVMNPELIVPHIVRFFNEDPVNAKL